jgi:hypothetical protein
MLTLVEIINIKTKPYYLSTEGRPYSEAKTNEIYFQLKKYYQQHPL